MAHILVTDAEERSVLAATRALRRSGHHVAAAGRSRLSPTHWSRACGERHVLPDPRLDSEGFVAGLEQLVRRDGYDLLMAGSDASVPVISAARERLEPYTRLGLPAHAVVRACGDKETLSRASREAGMSPPPSAVCRDPDEAAAAARELGYPVIVKPVRSADVAGTAVRQRPARFAAAAADLGAALSETGSPVLVQRYETARLHLSCGGLATDAGVVGLVAVRFHRTWPVRTGAAAFAETVDPPPGLSERAASVVERLGWRGVFELEVLVLDGGRLSAIDFNPRVFGWLTLAVEAGADLPSAWVETVLGGDARAGPPRPGLRYRWEDADVCHALWQLRRGRLHEAGRALRPRRHVTHAHFRAGDPGPLAARLLWALSRRGDAVRLRAPAIPRAAGSP